MAGYFETLWLVRRGGGDMAKVTGGGDDGEAEELGERCNDISDREVVAVADENALAKLYNYLIRNMTRMSLGFDNWL
ncbi:hypothetical protein GUJ93_ZPchr0006g43069 [Zizania palustris]|uniref:Uncharacterized protein n=1 Tax=Zizania palustris TaxID=103762 RepID=A0A8J5W3Y1_ZIZPA|nr:hypothetical protein GUJ93_ZPchr0006g43069 [Zizania palustris]